VTALPDVQDAMLRALFDEAPAEADLALLGTERSRVLLYRDLARSRIVELVEAALPRTIAALGAAARPAISAWLARGAPASRFFRELPLLFSDWLLGDVPIGAPPWLPDLVRLERARWLAMIAEEDPSTVEPFDLEKRPAPSATLTVLSPAWSVHRDEEPPVAGRFFVAVYRRPDHVVETRWNERVPGLLVEGWATADRTAIETVRAVLASEGITADHAFVERMSELATVLLERGALRGSRAS
jgi:hypothetical protein